MTKSTEEYLNEIKESLEKHGHSLEMRIAKVFQENGFSVSQFEYFVDQDTNLVRQIDVVASLSRIIAKQLVSINLVIECKYTKKKPWVILQTGQKFNKYAFFEQQLQGKIPANWKAIENPNGQFVGHLVLALMQSGDIDKFSVSSAGYTILESLKKSASNQKDRAYEAILQSGKAVEHIESRLHENNISALQELEYGTIDIGVGGTEEPHANLQLHFSITMPVIIIHGRLFEGRLNQNNQIDVKEIDYGIVLNAPRRYKAKRISKVPLSPVYVVTEAKLPIFIQEIKEKAEIILSQETIIIDIIEEQTAKLPSRKDDFDF